MSNEHIKKISIVLNGKDVEDSLTRVGVEVSNLRRKLRKANNAEDRKKANEELQVARKRYKEINDELRQQTVTFTDLRSAASNVFNGLLSGDFDAVNAGFTTIKNGINGALKSLWAFAANPAGVALIALAGVGLATKKWVDFNLEVAKTNQLVKDLTGQTGTAVDGIRIRAELLRDTFEVDLKTSIETAKSLALNMGITYNEAFDIIEKGAVKGKLKNDEYLDSLKEYPVQFKNAGYSAQEFAAIVESGIDLAIYTDKLPDAIKEAGIKLREGGDGLKKSLTDAFGSSFSDDILKRVQTGETSVKQALTELDKKSKEVNLNQSQRQELTSKLFISAGEDAGGAIKIFEALNLAITNQKKPLTEVQQLNKDNLDVQKKLQDVYTSLFATGDKGFTTWIAKGKLFLNQFLLKSLKSGVDFINWFIDMKNESRTFSILMVGAGKLITAAFKLAFAPLKGIVTSIKGVGLAIEGLSERDPAKIKEGLKQTFIKPFTDTFDTLKGEYQAFMTETDALRNGGVVELTKRISLDSFEDNTDAGPKEGDTKTEDGNTFVFTNGKWVLKNKTPTNSNVKSGLTDEDQKTTDKVVLSNEDKAKLDSKKALAKLLDEWELERKNIAEEKAQLESEENKEKELEFLNNKFDKIALEHEGETDLLLRLENERKAKINDITVKWQKKTEADAAKSNAKIRADKTRLNNAILNSSISLFDSETKLGKSLLAFKSFLAAKESLIQLGLLKSNVATKTAGAGVDIAAGKAKTAAAAPFPANIPLLLGFALQVGGVVSAIKSAGNVKKVAGFYKGGYTGNNALYNDGQDGVVGPVHVGEYVAPKWMVENPRYANTFKWLEAERTKGANNYSAALAPNTNSTNTNESQGLPPGTTDTGVEITAEDETENTDLGLVLNNINNTLNNLQVVINWGYTETEQVKKQLAELENSNKNGQLAE